MNHKHNINFLGEKFNLVHQWSSKANYIDMITISYVLVEEVMHFALLDGN